MPDTLAFFPTLGWTEIILLAVLGLLIFGRRLPEVGRSLGKGIVEFKRGLSGIEEDMENAGTAPPAGPAELDDGTTDAEEIDTTKQDETEEAGDPDPTRND